MAFEGEHKVIPIKGIMRAGADSVVEDGAMNEVIGLEYKDGSFVPYNYSAVGDCLVPTEIDKIYVHKTSEQTNIIIKVQTSLYWMVEDDFVSGKGEDLNNWVAINSSDVKYVEFVKNVLCISTNESLTYMLFYGGEYIDFNVYVENLPRISFRADIGIGGEDSKFVGVCQTQKNNTTDKDAIALMIKARGVAREEGGLTGYVIVCAAYRLKTGDYIKASNPVVLCLPMFKYRGRLYDVKNDTLNITWKPESGPSISFGADFNNKDVASYFEGQDGFINMYDKSVSGTSDIEKHYVFYEDGSYATNEGVKVYRSSEVFYPTMSCGKKGTTAASTIPTNKLQYKISDDIVNQDMLIDSLCIFMSQEIDPYITIDENSVGYKNQYDATSLTYDGVDYRTIKAKRKSLEDIKNELIDIKNLYLVKEISYDDVKKSDDWVDVKLKGKLGEHLVDMDTLPLLAFDNSVIKGASMSNYNSRLHIYNFDKQSIITAHVEDYNCYGGFGQNSVSKTVSYEEAYIIIESKSQEGFNRYVKHFDNIVMTGSSNPLLTPFLSSNIKDAVNIAFAFRNGINWIYKIFNMKKSGNGGYSFYLDKDIEPVSVNGYHSINDKIIPILSNSGRSVLQVSDTMLPNIFTYENTYVISNGSIIGIASLSIALSQDTFGQYPLLVFCTDGIYSMGIDTSGSGVYNNIAPFSREVCVNPNSICQIDGAVLFASSKGLMIATSQGVQEFVPTMNGLNRHIPKDDNSYGVGLKWYHDIINNSSSTQLLDSVDDELDFRDYVAAHDTYITYVSQKNKIVVYNENQPYIYWIDIPTRNVTKLPISIKLDNNDYPTELYVKPDGSILEFEQLSANVNTQTMFQTRPIKLDGGMKTAMRVIVRGYFNSNEADKWAVLLVLGSYDGINWQPIGLKQKPLDGGFNDLGCVVDRVSHKYMMVIFSASLNRDSHIDGIEMTVNNKYNNKLK